jgi:hypothetical protein
LDESYQEYINRVTRSTLPATCSTQLQIIQESPKFSDGQAQYFPGYTVITPPSSEDTINQAFYAKIVTIQEQLAQQLPANFFAVLPPASFHITVADLIWDDSYNRAVAENPDFEVKLQTAIADSFQQNREIDGAYKHRRTAGMSDETSDIASSPSRAVSAPHNLTQPVFWQLWGIVIRPRAIMACLVPKDRDSYDRIAQLRRCIYQNHTLMSLGIEQQYNFTAHITLGYFGKIPSDINRDRLCVTLSQINDRLVETDLPLFEIDRAELRKFDTMIEYYREADWAVVEFN